MYTCVRMDTMESSDGRRHGCEREREKTSTKLSTATLRRVLKYNIIFVFFARKYNIIFSSGESEKPDAEVKRTRHKTFKGLGVSRKQEEASLPGHNSS